MIRIDKFVGNVQDKYSSKSIIKDFDFHFDTQENNIDFAYYCLRYHLNYLTKIYAESTDTEGDIKIGKKFGFHYHLADKNEWWYFEVEIITKEKEFPIEDFLANKVNFKISMSSSTQVTHKEDIAILNAGFGEQE